ncbi:hypothetical protein QQX98_009993 [Neonectria punicea]|uniref:Xylanolytic transcriptional activator regulatory domain-containing protein n=1 Tax=Neonectria punicea TaxID=979145 RepID=A0ABR1GQP2_9HYPO
MGEAAQVTPTELSPTPFPTGSRGDVWDVQPAKAEAQTLSPPELEMDTIEALEWMKPRAVPKPKDGSWPVLFNMVLAVGAFAGPESSSNVDAFFYNRAREALSVRLLQRGSLHLVQAFSLMANYLQKRNKPNSGFTFLGIAFNMAMGLGLHREFPDQSMSASAMEIRRRVWWTLFIFDSGARLTFGRPSISLAGVNVRAPENLNDDDLTVDIEVLRASRAQPTITSSLIWQRKLAEISNVANAKLLEERLPKKSLMLALDDQIVAWKEAPPSYFDEALGAELSWFAVPRMILLWRSQHLRIVLTRPFLLDVLQRHQELDLSHPDEAVGRCISAAEDCVKSIIGFCASQNGYTGALVWYATYWPVTAVFVSVTRLIYAPHHPSAPV